MGRCCSNHLSVCWPPTPAVVTASDWPAGAIPPASFGAPEAPEASIGLGLDGRNPTMKEAPYEIEIFLR